MVGQVEYLQKGEMYLVKRDDGSMYPADGESALKWARMRPGEVKVKVERSRNGKMHRKYMKMISSAFVNQDRYKSKDELRKAIALDMGFVDVVHDLRTDEITRTPRSIAFANMGQDEFDELYRATVDALFAAFDLGENWVSMVMHYA